MIIRFILLFFCLVLFSGTAIGEEYYSAPKATPADNVSDDGDTVWNAAQDIASPCSIGTALAHAAAGDTVYFRGGSYDINYAWSSVWTGLLRPAHSGVSGSPIVLTNYAAEVPILNVVNYGGDDYTTVFSTSYQSYITFENFKIWGDGGTNTTSVAIFGSDDGEYSSDWKHGCIFRNLEIDGGSANTDDDNREGIFVQGVVEFKVYQNVIYGYDANSGDNHAGIKIYHVQDGEVYNNTIYDCINGIYSKSNMDNVSIYNNFIYNANRGIYDNSYTAQARSSNNNKIYNNLIVNIGYMGVRFKTEDGVTEVGNQIYHNTIYESNIGVRTQNIDDIVIRDNLIRRQAGSSEYSIALGETFTFDACDYNLFDNSMGFRITDRFDLGGATIWTDLASWQAATVGGINPGAHSLYSAPIYENGSGNMDTPEDFKLTSTSPGYQSASDGTDMGADVLQVGATPGLDCGDYDGDQTACESNGCTYCSADDTCGSTECCGDSAPQCGDQTSCEDAGWNWCTDVCQEDECAGPPPECVNCVYLDGPGRVDLN